MCDEKAETWQSSAQIAVLVLEAGISKSDFRLHQFFLWCKETEFGTILFYSWIRRKLKWEYITNRMKIQVIGLFLFYVTIKIFSTMLQIFFYQSYWTECVIFIEAKVLAVSWSGAYRCMLAQCQHGKTTAMALGTVHMGFVFLKLEGF